MGEHIDNRKGFRKHKKFSEGVEPAARARRVTFKSYLREIEEELLEDELEELEKPAVDDDKDPAGI